MEEIDLRDLFKIILEKKSYYTFNNYGLFIYWICL